MRLLHEKVKDYQCQSCDKMFGYKGNLEQHVKAVHENIREHACNSCGKRFHVKSRLKRHTESVHEKIKVFKCDSCGKTFGMKGKLTSHLNRSRCKNWFHEWKKSNKNEYTGDQNPNLKT